MMTTLLLLYYDDYKNDDEKEREPASLFFNMKRMIFVVHSLYLCFAFTKKCIERYLDYGGGGDDGMMMMR